MADIPPNSPTGAAIAFVSEGWDFFEDKVNFFAAQTMNLITGLTALPAVQPVIFDVQFPDISGLTAFVAPPRPTLTPMTFGNVDVPEAPVIDAPIEDAMAAAPAFDVPQPNPVSLPAQPGAFNVPSPGAAPQLTTLVLPASPDYVLPPLPAFFDIVIPEKPSVNYPAFSGRDPGDAPLPPNLAGIGFTEEAYTREILPDVMAQVRRSLAGGTGLSASIEAQLFGRARDRARKTSLKARQEVANEFTSRGFTEPTGAFAARMAEQTQVSQSADNDINRDLSIAFHEQEIKNVQFAVVQGIALETLLIGQHSAIQDRQLQAAKLMLDAQVALHNADVASYNAKIERLKADASVFETVIRGEVAKVEAYKAEVDGQRAIAETNQAAAQAYESGVKGVLGLVEIYKAQVGAVETQARIEALRIEAHGSEVQAFVAQTQAYSARWDGYKTAVEAEQAGFRSFEIGVNAFNARTNAWATGEQVKMGRQDNRIKTKGLQLDAYRSRIQQVVAQLQKESARIEALGTFADAQAKLYTADAQVESSRTDANTRAFEAELNYHDRRAQAQLSEAQIKIQDAARLLTAQVTAVGGAANALAQLTSSAMSAVNFSAGVSGSGSESWGFSNSLSKSKGWQWGGETEDNNHPDIW